MKEVNWIMDTLTSTVEELYTLYQRDIVRFFAEHLADRDTSWDLCHEVFVRLLIALASGTQLQHPQRWLMRVAKNLLIDTYRHKQAKAEMDIPFDSIELEMFASDATTYKTLIEHTDMVQVIVETFRALPEKYQRLLFWREIERLPLQEIAIRTGTAEPVLSTELWRARKLLQKEYQRRRFKDLLPADEEIFEHLDALIRFNVTTSPEEQLRRIEMHERDYFEQIAPTWDAYVASAYEAELQERLTSLLPWHQDMTVLDVGTGTGYLVLLHHVVSPRTILAELRRVVRPDGYVVIIDAHAHKHHWTPEAFGDLHYGTDLKKLQRHVSALQMKTLLVEDAGISHSGNFIGRKADFTNFLLVGQTHGRGRTTNDPDNGRS